TTVNVSVPLIAGWNMVSNPVTRAAGTDSMKQVFTQSLFAYGFSFGGSYVQDTTLENMTGYWGKFPGGVVPEVIAGGARSLDSVTVAARWNMVGSLTTPIDTSAPRITSNPVGIRGSAWFGYGVTGYAGTGTIEPGKAYWVKATLPGKFYFSAGPAPERAEGSAGRTLGDLSSITVTDSRGSSQTLYFGADAESEIPVEMYEMPPAAPAGMVDARFVEGERGMLVRTLGKGAEGGEFEIAVEASAYPVTVSWSVVEDGYGYEVRDGSGAGVLGVREMRGEGSVRVEKGLRRLVVRAGSGEGVPLTYGLMQNYPNPFNPVTTVRFALPVESRVGVEVYNLLGQRVRTLVRGDMKAGYHGVEWNGRGEDGGPVGSGVYFVRMEASGRDGRSFSGVMKMMLLK
ncbi:MAG: FlgD immunoglobulin-like domain containing protein, partial [Bacteroidota bacterium]